VIGAIYSCTRCGLANAICEVLPGADVQAEINADHARRSTVALYGGVVSVPCDGTPTIEAAPKPPTPSTARDGAEQAAQPRPVPEFLRKR